jgi:hypothetical protein
LAAAVCLRLAVVVVVRRLLALLVLAVQVWAVQVH